MIASDEWPVGLMQRYLVEFGNPRRISGPRPFGPCRRKIEMTPGAQSRDDIAAGGGYSEPGTASKPNAGEAELHPCSEVERRI